MLSCKESKVGVFFDLYTCSCIPLVVAQFHIVLSTIVSCYVYCLENLSLCNAFCLFTTVIFEFSFRLKYF